MKITVYTIPDCQFSKQEKDYLIANKLTYEEKNLEANREFLTEMMTLSNNFAGTPVTKIEKDDGKIEIMKGFTKDDFDKVLGLVKTEESKPAEPALSEMNAQVATPTQAPVPARQQPEPQPMAGGPQPPEPVIETPPATEPTPTPEEPKPEAPVEPSMPATPPATPEPTPVQPMPTPEPATPDQPKSDQPMAEKPADDQLKSVLNDLKEKAGDTATPPPANTATPSPANLPNIPPFE